MSRNDKQCQYIFKCYCILFFNCLWLDMVRVTSLTIGAHLGFLPGLSCIVLYFLDEAARGHCAGDEKRKIQLQQPKLGL